MNSGNCFALTRERGSATILSVRVMTPMRTVKNLADMDITSRFGLEFADLHVTVAAGRRGKGARLENPQAPEQFVETRVVHGGRLRLEGNPIEGASLLRRSMRQYPPAACAAPRPARRGGRPGAVHNRRADRGLRLYPEQEEAILELFSGNNVILNTPTGSGKSLVAAAFHFKALCAGERSVYTCPIKALVNEKFLALCRDFGPENVGMMTGDASVNPQAPSSAAPRRSSPTSPWPGARRATSGR